MLASATAKSEEVLELPSISVDSLLPGDIRATPGAASVLNTEEIEQLRPYTLHDAFDFIPGVRTIDDDVTGRRSAIAVRGAPSRRSRKTLLLEDGVPINGSSYLDPSAHYTPPMERLEGIDVLKGTGHVIHGPLNNHGIINFRNKRPTLTPKTTVELALGENDTFKRHFMHQRTEGSLGMVFAYTGMNAEGVFDNEDMQFDDFFASLDWQINDRHALSGSLVYLRERFDGYDESNLLPQEYARNPYNKSNRLVLDGGITSATGWGQEHNNISVNYYKLDLKHDFQVTDDLFVSTGVFATDLDRPRFTADPEEIAYDPNSAVLDFDTHGGTPFIEGVQGEMVGRVRIYRTYGIETQMELSNIDAWGIDHTLQWGARYERHLQDDTRRGGEEGEVLDENNRGVKTRDVTLQAWATSVFFQDAMQFGDWTVTPGVRLEYYEQKRHRNYLAIYDEQVRPTLTTNETLVLPSITALYEGLDETELFASVGRGYTPGFARTADDDDFPLKPEVGINYQIGMRSAALKGLKIEAALFYNDIEDTIVQLPYTNDFQNIYINAADSESYGVDLALRLDSNAYVKSALNAYGILAYSYTLAEFTNGILDGNRVPEVPLHSGSFTLGLEHKAGWDISATLSYFGSFYTDPNNTKDQTVANEDGDLLAAGDELEIREPIILGQVDNYTLLSARASYTLPNTNTTFWVQGRNLTDKRYIVDLNNGIRPGAQRTFMAGVKIEF
jgi:Fe(3+) dicitrate transport protein